MYINWNTNVGIAMARSNKVQAANSSNFRCYANYS